MLSLQIECGSVSLRLLKLESTRLILRRKCSEQAERVVDVVDRK